MARTLPQRGALLKRTIAGARPGARAGLGEGAPPLSKRKARAPRAAEGGEKEERSRRDNYTVNGEAYNGGMFLWAGGLRNRAKFFVCVSCFFLALELMKPCQTFVFLVVL